MAGAQDQSIVNVIGDYGQRLLAFIRSRVRSQEDAEDILQDVWYQLSRGVDLEELENVGSWLYKTARNRIVDRYRKKSEITLSDRLADDEEVLLLDELDLPNDEFFSEVFWEELMSALDGLPTAQREVFVRNEIDGLTLQEIADDQGANLKTVISRKRYAVQHLRKRLQDLYDELNEL